MVSGQRPELFEIEDLIRSFSLEGVSKANAVFNPDKLAWFNLQHIQRLPDEKLVAYVKPEFEKAGLWRVEFQGGRYEWFCAMLALLRPRAKTLLEFPRMARMFIIDGVESDPAAVDKFLKDPAIRQHLATLSARLAALPEFTVQSTEAATRSLAEELDIKPGTLMNAARVALTGQPVAPGLFDVMVTLGSEKTVSRLRI